MATTLTSSLKLLILPTTLAAAIIGSAIVTPISARATSQPKTVASQLTLDNNGTFVASYVSPCTKKGICDNGLRLTWAQGPCYDQRTYPPLAVGWFYQNIPTAKYWPIASPCGVGITMEWSPGGTLQPPNWVHAPLKNQDLVRFPKHANGATVYSYGGHAPTQAQWLLNGKVKSTIALPAADDAAWSSDPTPPASASKRVHKNSSPAAPTIVLLGRKGSFTDAWSTTSAPSNADGIQLAWFLSEQQKGQGRGRGCRLVDGTYWTDPPVMFEYTANGALEGRLNLLACPTDRGGDPLDFNMLDFNWKENSSDNGYVLDGISASINNQPVQGNTSDWFPAPPSGTNGLYFESDLDDFQWAYWLNGSSYLGGAISHPAHVRLETWAG